MIDSYKEDYPNIHDTAFVADSAFVNGDVTIGAESSVWFNVVIRGDVAPTVIGKRVNIQDGSVIHQSPNRPVIIEDDVTVGHKVIIHAATIHKNTLIGMGAVILDGAEIGENAMIAAGSIVPPGKKIPPNTLYMGNPAIFVRELKESDYKEMDRITNSYIKQGKYYKEKQMMKV